jgi:hypothetical protein
LQDRARARCRAGNRLPEVVRVARIAKGRIDLRAFARGARTPGIGAFLDAAVDPMGKSYAVFFGKVTGWAADGTLSWTKDYSIDLLSPQNQDFHVAADPKGQGFYTFGGYYPRCVLAHWNTDGVPVWYRDSMQQQKVLDPVEGVMWTGGFNRCRGILSTTDAVYVFGMYTTQIKNGSTIRKDQGESVFIGRYDLDGNQVWFKQYVGPDTGGNFNYPGNPLLAVGANGDLVFTTTAKYITHLHAMTGEPF